MGLAFVDELLEAVDAERRPLRLELNNHLALAAAARRRDSQRDGVAAFRRGRRHRDTCAGTKGAVARRWCGVSCACVCCARQRTQGSGAATSHAVHMHVSLAHLQQRRQRAPGRCGGRCRARPATSPGRTASQMPPHAGRRPTGWAAAARRPRRRGPRERTWRRRRDETGHPCESAPRRSVTVGGVRRL